MPDTPPHLSDTSAADIRTRVLALRDLAVRELGIPGGVDWLFRPHELLHTVAPAVAAWHSTRLPLLAADVLQWDVRRRAIPGQL